MKSLQIVLLGIFFLAMSGAGFAAEQEALNDTIYIVSTHLPQSLIDNLQATFQKHSIKLRIISSEQYDSFGRKPDTLFLDDVIDEDENSITVFTVLYEKSPLVKQVSPFLLPSMEKFYWQIPTDNTHTAAFNFVVGLGFYSIDRCDIATSYFEAMLDDTEIPELKAAVSHFYQANCAIMDGDYALAAKELEGIETQIEDDTVGFYLYPNFNLAWTYLQIGRTDDAISLMNRIANSSIGKLHDSYTLATRAEFYMLVPHYDNALADINAALELEPNNNGFYIQRGQVYLNLYEWDKSLGAFNTAIELAPEYADAYFQRGVLYYSILQTGQELREEALTDFRHYLELAPDGEYADQAREYADKIEAELAALNE
jgi:tetratricopeptide (TPR) repeat protein